jgi:hypothetical protein
MVQLSKVPGNATEASSRVQRPFLNSRPGYNDFLAVAQIAVVRRDLYSVADVHHVHAT